MNLEKELLSREQLGELIMPAIRGTLGCRVIEKVEIVRVADLASNWRLGRTWPDLPPIARLEAEEYIAGLQGKYELAY